MAQGCERIQDAMQIQIIAIGKIREAYLREGIAIYTTRLLPHHKVLIIDIHEERLPDRCSETEKQRAREREGARLRSASPNDTVAIALDPAGKMLSSSELAETIAQWELKGQGNLSFYIGGPLGLAPEILGSADLVLSLSKMTFPHQLARLILIEQLYRADCIRRGIPYHK